MQIIAVGAARMVICAGCHAVYSQVSVNPMVPRGEIWEPPCCPRCGLPAFPEE